MMTDNSENPKPVKNRVQIGMRILENGNIKPVLIRTEQGSEFYKEFKVQNNTYSISSKEQLSVLHEQVKKQVLEKKLNLSVVNDSRSEHDMILPAIKTGQLNNLVASQNEKYGSVAIAKQSEEHRFEMSCRNAVSTSTQCEEVNTVDEFEDCKEIDFGSVDESHYIHLNDEEDRDDEHHTEVQTEQAADLEIASNDKTEDVQLDVSLDYTDLEDIGVETKDEGYEFEPVTRKKIFMKSSQKKLNKYKMYLYQQDLKVATTEGLMKYPTAEEYQTIALMKQKELNEFKVQGIRCQLCGNTYSTKNSLEVHIEEQHYHAYISQCSTCFKPFHNLTDKSNHNCRFIKRVSSHICLQCSDGKFYRYRENLAKHIKKEHNSKFPLACIICNLPLISNLEKNLHMLNKHKIAEASYKLFIKEKLDGTIDVVQYNDPCIDKVKLDTSSSTGPVLSCGKCGKVFHDPLKHESHVKQVCIDAKHVCEICGKTFKSKKRLRDHTITHSGVRAFVCDLCGETYAYKNSLNNHLVSKHTSEKNYKCGVCGKEFALCHSFRRHEKIHKGVKPYECQYCRKTFSTGWNRKAHLRQHTKETPYTCSKCGLGFAHNVVRKNHEAKCQS